MFRKSEGNSSSESRDSGSGLTLMMTSAQVVETSVTTINNSPTQDYTH